ncbi:DUF305 domain-containing protein [Arthrobacter sp. LAPM80]|uniref:DUF305 domain-containing protein n=1 Tax=Arthrobacter sp. LAPM80 TaxID=3141788 RepID=UPI00398A887B
MSNIMLAKTGLNPKVTALATQIKAAQGNDASKLFLTQMIAHQQGAVAMAKSEVTGGKNADAVALAKSITASQETEINDLLAAL